MRITDLHKGTDHLYGQSLPETPPDKASDAIPAAPGGGAMPEERSRRRLGRKRKGGPGPSALEVGLDDEGAREAAAFVERALSAYRVTRTIAAETSELCAALFREMASQFGPDTRVSLSSESRLGRSDVKMSFPGQRFEIPEGGPDGSDAKVIAGLADKLSSSYRGGINVVRVSVSQSRNAALLPNLVAIALAFVVSLPMYLLMGEDETARLSSEVFGPLIKIFTNAVLMVGAPMTLFSLLKNTTDAFIVSGRGSASRRLFFTSMGSSIVAIVLATAIGFAVATFILKLSGVTESVDLGLSSWSLASAVDQIVPSSILKPFETISPVPMIVVALLVTYALFSIGPSFEMMKKAIDACYDLFSRILHIVMSVFPIACFVLFLDLMLGGDIWELVGSAILVAVVFAGTGFLYLVYALRLKLHGIKVVPFVRKLRPLMKENYAIGSVIDAVPFNVRYCSKVFGVSRERLEKELPVTAQTNLDGNCFIIMLLTVLYIFLSNSPVSWFNIVVIALIVLFLSFGAPNQPGSILIGMLIIFAYLDPAASVATALYYELFCGAHQNIINVIGSVVAVACNDADEARGIIRD